MPLLRLEVVTPQRKVLETEAESIIVPGVDGYVGFQANHAPIVAGLGIGVLEYGPAGGKKECMAISGGFVEVAENRVSILADAAERPEEIDVARAEAARQRAERRLKERSENIDRARAEAALRRALNRIRIAQMVV